MKVSNYVKGIAAGVGTLATVVIAATTDNLITNAEWGLIVASGLTLLGVVFLPNAEAPK